MLRSVATRQFRSLIPMVFAVLADTALARSYLNCLTKKVVIVDAPNGSTSSTIEENLGFWIDEPAKIVTLADGKMLVVGRFDDRWISAASGDASYELDRQNGNLMYASSTMKDGIATTIKRFCWQARRGGVSGGCCAAGFQSRLCLLRVISALGNRGGAAAYVCFCSNTGHANAQQQNAALCQKRTYAAQQTMRPVSPSA